MSDSSGCSISVLVVNHDSGRHLRDCLRRLHQLAADWPAAAAGGIELLVVDNASMDGSEKAVEESRRALEASPLSVRLIDAGANLGFGAACNLGAADAGGRYLLLLNPDAWTDARSLRALWRALESDRRLAAAAPALVYPDGSPQFTWAPTVGVAGEAVQRLRNGFEAGAWNHGLLPALLGPFLGPGWFSAACLLLRRSAFEKAGGFDPGFFLYFEDADLGLRLARAGWRQRRVPGARATHVRGVTTGQPPTRALRPEVELHYRASQLRYYDLHRPRWERAWLRRRLRRKFRAHADSEPGRSVLGLLDAPAAARPEIDGRLE